MKTDTESETRSSRSETGLARSAGIIGLGSIASRVIGVAREVVTSYFFGSSGELSAYIIASNVPFMLYDLLVGGMLSAALVPVFSTYAGRERRGELARIVSAILTLIGVALAIVVILLEIFAVPVANILGDFEDPALQTVLANCLRLISPALILFGIWGGVTGLLYALKRFNYTALSAAVFNLGIVIAAPLLSDRIGIYALPIGFLAGAIVQLAVTIPGLRDVRLRFSAAWNHPAVRRILRLYLPIALGLIITQMQIIVDRRWASAAGAESVSWMRYATTLIQMPLGLVPVAVSLASLPSLSQRASAGDWDAFRGIFAPRPAAGAGTAYPGNRCPLGVGRAGNPGSVPAWRLHRDRHGLDRAGVAPVSVRPDVRRGGFPAELHVLCPAGYPYARDRRCDCRWRVFRGRMDFERAARVPWLGAG